MEDLAAQVAPDAVPSLPRTPRAGCAGPAIARGRICCDPLAGRLGTAVTDALTQHGVLRQDTGCALGAGPTWFTSAGIGLDRRVGGPRPAPASTGPNAACIPSASRARHVFMKQVDRGR
ncbi:hypothetical protein ABZ354_08760 [Streptomyces sp. NPDC005925]|uniref:hypothetical protein n=1 Tax=Streptomyces sp. NPDC005925 TaxID=3157172 RepID=UPI0033EABF53